MSLSLRIHTEPVVQHFSFLSTAWQIDHKILLYGWVVLQGGGFQRCHRVSSEVSSRCPSGCPPRCPPRCLPGVRQGVLQGVRQGVRQGVLQGVLQVSAREDTLPILFIYRKLYSLRKECAKIACIQKTNFRDLPSSSGSSHQIGLLIGSPVSTAVE
jgi:hypothetical protein